MKVIVFDIGGTLMEYRDMPGVWIDFYPAALERVRRELLPELTDAELSRSLEILRSYNPSVRYREKEYPPEVIFGDACAHWPGSFSLQEVIRIFYGSMKLTPVLFPETADVLQQLRDAGYRIAALTDVATGMPDELHRDGCADLMPFFDRYVSSLSCGWRKPNPGGLEDIADSFGVSPSGMIMVGDERKDAEAAARFGCRSVIIDRRSRCPDFGQDWTFSDLRPLPGLLAGL